MKQEFAIKFRDRPLSVSSELDSVLNNLRDNLSEEEFLKYRAIFSEIMGNIAIDLIFPIYKKFPEIAPDLDKDRGEK